MTTDGRMTNETPAGQHRAPARPTEGAHRLIVVGASLGGLEALQVLLNGIPSDFPVPMIIVQHRTKTAGDLLCQVMQSYCARPLSEPEDKQAIVPRCVYLAPSDYHLLVEAGCMALSVDEPINQARPSVDVLFESAAAAYGSGLIGVILTGTNEDGAQGARAIKAHGGLVVVQDPATARSRAMPEGALRAAKVDQILPLAEIAPFLVTWCGKGGTA